MVEARTCRACQKVLQGKYCYDCGQLDQSLDLTTFQLLRMWISEFLSSDRQILKTTWFLFTKPGQLTVEHLAGRRSQYASPFRLFLCAVVVLLLVQSCAGVSLIDIDESENTPQKSQSVPSQTSIAKPQVKEPPVGRAPGMIGDPGSGDGKVTFSLTDETGERRELFERLHALGTDQANCALLGGLRLSILLLVPILALCIRVFHAWSFRTHQNMVFALHFYSFIFMLSSLWIVGHAVVGGVGSAFAALLLVLVAMAYFIRSLLVVYQRPVFRTVVFGLVGSAVSLAVWVSLIIATALFSAGGTQYLLETGGTLARWIMPDRLVSLFSLLSSGWNIG